MKKLFVGSLAWATDDESLKQFFSQFGTVAKAEVVKERDNPNRSRGFAFVEFEDDAAADEAIAKGNEAELDGRKITVSEAQSKPREDRGPRRDNNNRGSGSFRQRSW